MSSFSQRLIATMRRAVEWGDRRVPPGVRSVLGLLLVVGGVLGFLPLLGFWMLPIGLPLRRRLLAWLRRRDRRPMLLPGAGRHIGMAPRQHVGKPMERRGTSDVGSRSTPNPQTE
jgi:hypothetical protein